MNTGMNENRFIAHNTSDTKDWWPNWMVWNGHVNVTGRVARALGKDWPYGAVITTKAIAQELADEANAKGIKL